MPIRVIHGNGDLIGAAFQGVGDAADKITDQRNVNRELEDREARTAAYLQRIEDARALGQQELELEREELMRENARQDALRKATMGMAQDQVGQFSQSPYWTKQDEAGLRRIFADKSLEEKDRQEIADSYLETVAGRIAEDEVRGQRAKLTDIVQRMAQPDANGNVYLQPDEAEVWGQEIAASDNPARLYEDLRRVVSSAVKVEGVNRQMSQAMTMIDEGLASGQLDDEREEELEDIKARLLTGEIKPSMAKMLARVAVNGDSAALREFSQLVQAGSPALNGGAQPTDTPGGGISDEDAVQPGNTLAQAVMQSDQPVAGVSQEDWLKANAYRKTYGDSAAGIVAGFLLTGQKNVVQKAIDEMRAATNDVPEDAPDSEVLAAAAHVAGKYGLKASPAELVALAGGMVHLGETPDGSPIQVPLDQYLEALKRKEEARKKQQDEDMGYGHPAFGPQPVMEGPDKGFDYYQEAAGSGVVKQSLGGAKR